MTRRKMPKYWPLLEIPEGKVGEYRIRHRRFKTGHVFQCSSVRTSLIGGQADKPVSFPLPVRFHELSGEAGVWMTDLPIEQAQADPIFRDYAGAVLVGGLGLGYAASRIALKTKVRRVVVVEISPEVIALVEPYLPARAYNKIEVVCGDLHRYLADTTGQFDFAFYDIWQSDGEGTFFETVVPLLKASPRVVKQRPDCWNENVMRGQLMLGLHSNVMMLQLPEAEREKFQHPSLDEMCEEKGTIWWDWKVPFFRWYRETKEASEFAVRFYCQAYGRADFDELWPLQRPT